MERPIPLLVSRTRARCLVPDHLGMVAPFPALVAAAEATGRPRLGTFVLNCGFWNPALLAREVATTDALTGAKATEQGMTALAPGELDGRVAAYRGFAAGRESPAELNILLQLVAVTTDRPAAVRPLLEHLPGMTEDDLLKAPLMAAGTVRQLADQLREQRERYGFSYLTVLDPYMEAFGPVIEELGGT
ncbi:hypothetical protein ACFXOY_08150 [Streptomyces niveus]|uniref:hypothetical protein n=1 Tax=Streptomyces niveus TaxID=193462 RepID=UPI00367823BB